MSQYNSHEKLNRLLASYVPEFAYERESDEPGCVLTTLCGDMLEESAERYDRVFHKHKVQFLNLFEHLCQEPVSASKGYAQFLPLEGYTESVPVPAGTQVSAQDGDVGDIVFTTGHDISVTSARPQVLVMTGKNCIVKTETEDVLPPFTAFDLSGENLCEHKLYLSFDYLFDAVEQVDFQMQIALHESQQEQDFYRLLASPQVEWYFLDNKGEKAQSCQVENTADGLHFTCADYQPVKSLLGSHEGYVLVLDAGVQFPEVYLDSLTVTMEQKNKVPRRLYVNDILEVSGSFYPFGKPLAIYNEFSIEDVEVFSKRGSKVELDFHLDFHLHEENFEIPEIDIEYKSIMKKPPKTAGIKPMEVSADYVIWEYLSTTGWKRLFREEKPCTLFQGSVSGEMHLEFDCPEDLAAYDDTQIGGRIRARLLRADNIYRMPAIYHCPVLTDIRISYSYQEKKRYPDYAYLKNNFEEKDITAALQTGANVKPFYSLELEERAMYLGFPIPPIGTPVSLYLDLESDGSRRVRFQAEYLSEYGFTPIRVVDTTDALSGSGTILMILPRDMQRAELYGYEGYFLRFRCREEKVREYALPKVKGIYMNMAKVKNENLRVEEFYLDDLETTVNLQLAGENLLQAELYVNQESEQGDTKENWVRWERQDGFSARKNSYQIDMAAGLVTIHRIALCAAKLSPDGPHVRVEYCNYKGSQANLPAGSINTLQNSLRYISGVTNPFDTYGGYDGYQEQTAQRLVAGLLRTRNRTVTEADFEDMVAQAAYGVRRVKCMRDLSVYGEPEANTLTVAVLIEEYEKGTPVFGEIKEDVRKKLLETGTMLPEGRKLVITQPHFMKLNVRVWLEKETMDHAYDIQNRAEQLITQFIDPLYGGPGKKGWEIGDFPRASQIVAYLRANLTDCNVARIILSAMVDGREVDVREDFYEKSTHPFCMAVNGRHLVYIDTLG